MNILLLSGYKDKKEEIDRNDQLNLFSLSGAYMWLYDKLNLRLVNTYIKSLSYFEENVYIYIYIYIYIYMCVCVCVCVCACVCERENERERERERDGFVWFLCLMTYQPL